MEKELETGEKTENKTHNKTEQNNRRYKAFISYRHQPFDRKVAVTLQKHLETFHPPKQLEKKEKWRVFRDETELPTSADLNQDIREALEKSEYVVVWKTQNPDEILLQNQAQAWLINLDKMEIRYEIGDDVKGQFAGYSQKENKVLMKNWLEEKYWICPLYTAEELKELGTKWKNQAE